MLVVDANVAVAACVYVGGFDVFRDHELIAPPLMSSEFLSSFRESVHRGETTARLALAALENLEKSRIRFVAPARLRKTAWEIATSLGWAKTYDAEYLALARLRECQVVTLDGRLRRGAARLGTVVGLDEI